MKPNQKHIWLVLRKIEKEWLPYEACSSRSEARIIIDYFNGFCKGTKDAKYRVKKYTEAK